MIINCTITRNVYCVYIIQFAFFQKFQDVSNSDFEPILLNGPNIFIPLHCLKAQYFCLKICPSLCILFLEGTLHCELTHKGLTILLTGS